jgi:hypothetical protein
VKNILWPQIGAAGTPYARSVRAEAIQPISLPDPGVIFDSVMARKDFKPHPNKISSVLFYLATIIIHGMSLVLQRGLVLIYVRFVSNKS